MTLLAAAVAAAAAVLAFGLVAALRPFLLRHALARPNARSSHREPTPQGGGVAVVAAALAAAGGGLWAAGLDGRPVPWVAAAILALAAIGFADDIRPLPVRLRLTVQAGCAAALVILAAPAGRILPEAVPAGIASALLVLALVWWINVANFMDGIDWITVAEFLPMTLALCLMGLAGHASGAVAVAAAALMGALAGFAPWNRPVARLFLGDVGSLPIGLATGWMLLDLAARGAPAAAILLPLYYLADATLTLVRRALAGERVWEAHRTHFYQRALGNGLGVLAVDARVLGLNLCLAALAGATLAWPDPAAQVACLAGGAALVGATLRRFATPGA